MSPWERWKKVSINNKLMIYMTAILAVATTLYTLMYRSQVNFMKENAIQTAEQTNRLVNASERLAQTTNNTLEEAKRVNKEAGDRADRTTKAIETQANASMSQAGTSKIATEAAKESAQTTSQLYRAGQRPKIFFKWVKWREKPIANKKFDAEFAVSNSGGTAYGLTNEMTVAVVPRDFEGLLPYSSQGSPPHSPPNIEINEAPMEQGADQTFTTEFDLMLNDAGAKLFEDDQVVIVFYGHFWWKDSLGRGDGFAFCRAYSKKIYPNLTFCRRQGKIPKGTYPY